MLRLGSARIYLVGALVGAAAFAPAQITSTNFLLWGDAYGALYDASGDYNSGYDDNGNSINCPPFPGNYNFSRTLSDGVNAHALLSALSLTAVANSGNTSYGASYYGNINTQSAVTPGRPMWEYDAEAFVEANVTFHLATPGKLVVTETTPGAGGTASFDWVNLTGVGEGTLQLYVIEVDHVFVAVSQQGGDNLYVAMNLPSGDHIVDVVAYAYTDGTTLTGPLGVNNSASYTVALTATHPPGKDKSTKGR